MKEKKKKKNNKKNILKKLNNCLNDNAPLTDFISKIFFALITIIIAINANQIAMKQNDIDEINIIPNLVVEYEPEYEIYEKIKIINNGGPIYNIQSEAYTFLHVVCSITDTVAEIPVELYHKSETGNNTGIVVFYEEFNHIEFDVTAQMIKEKINEILDEDIDSIRLVPTTFLKISYEDKFHNYTVKYFCGEYLEENEQAALKKINEYVSPMRIASTSLKDLIYKKILEKYQNS